MRQVRAQCSQINIADSWGPGSVTYVVAENLCYGRFGNGNLWLHLLTLFHAYGSLLLFLTYRITKLLNDVYF